MGIELINLSNETKAYLNNLRRAIEKQAEATEKLARAQKPKFVELPTSNGSIYVRADCINCITDECDGVCLTISGDGGYKVKMSYLEVVAELNDALGITDKYSTKEGEA